MRVLMVSTNRLRMPQPVLPTGMCMVAEATESAGHTVELLDLCFEKDPVSAVVKAISKFAPEAIAFSIRNLDNSDAMSPAWYLDDAREIVRAIRKCSDATVIIGGPAVSIAPAAVRSYLNADYAIAGEGEIEFPKLLASIEEGGRTDGVIYASPLERLQSASCEHSLKKLNLRRYAAYGTPASVQTKRGCERKCVYCTYASIEGDRYRLKPPSAVVEEIEAAASLGFKTAEFTDSVFNLPYEHASAVCEALIKKNNRVPMHTTTVSPSGASVEMFRLMEHAGFVGISSSLESASDEVLQAMGKGYTVQEVADTVRAARMTSIARMWIFLLGGPGESERTVKETLNFIRKYMSDRDIVLLTCGVRIYPGTELERIARQEGVIREADDLLKPTFYYANGLNEERIRRLISEADLRSGNTVLFSELGWSALPLALRIHTLLRLKPPYWRYTRKALKLRRIF